MKKVGLTSLVIAALSTVACFSIGFAEWSIPTSKVDVSGGISTDSHQMTHVTYNEYITVNEVQPIGYLQGYGFNNLETGEYSSSIVLKINCAFDRAKAIADGAIVSLMSSNKMSLKVTLSIPSNENLISQFSVNDMPIISTGFYSISGATGVVKTNISIYKQWNIGYVNTIDSIMFTTQIQLRYTGSLSSFPDLSVNKFSVSLLLGEYKNA